MPNLPKPIYVNLQDAKSGGGQKVRGGRSRSSGSQEMFLVNSEWYVINTFSLMEM